MKAFLSSQRNRKESKSFTFRVGVLISPQSAWAGAQQKAPLVGAGLMALGRVSMPILAESGGHDEPISETAALASRSGEPLI
jgi:hypothetical protein